MTPSLEAEIAAAVALMKAVEISEHQEPEDYYDALLNLRVAGPAHVELIQRLGCALAAAQADAESHEREVALLSATVETAVAKLCHKCRGHLMNAAIDAARQQQDNSQP